MDIPEGGIGFFDSGLGGLTVLSACLDGLGLPVCYYGDNARAPYGGLPEEKILAYAEEAFDAFSALRVRAAVIACNTVTAVCADRLREKYPFPVVGAEPARARRGAEGRADLRARHARHRAERSFSLPLRPRRQGISRRPYLRLSLSGTRRVGGKERADGGKDSASLPSASGEAGRRGPRLYALRLFTGGNRCVVRLPRL